MDLQPKRETETRKPKPNKIKKHIMRRSAATRAWPRISELLADFLI